MRAYFAAWRHLLEQYTAVVYAMNTCPQIGQMWEPRRRKATKAW